MKIAVTKHAIKRYRERVFDYTSSEETIVTAIKEIARRGKQICVRPASWKNCFEVKYRGISIVSLMYNHKAVVLTVLGDRSYRKWIKRNEMNVKHGEGIRCPV